MSIRLVHALVVACCFSLLACQTRSTLVEGPRAPTVTPAPMIATAPGPKYPALATSVSFATAIATAPAGASPVAAGSPTVGSPVVAARTPSPTSVAAVPNPPACAYGATRRLVEVQDRALKEASALAASQRWPGVYWTLNDSGNSPTVYAVDDQGRSRGTFRVDDAENEDWESLQVGPGRDGASALYIGDTGDNDRERRDIVIYRIPEPEPTQPGARSSNARTSQAEAFKLQYPNGARDAEGLLVHPKTGEMLIVTKEALGRATIYRVPAPLDSRRSMKLERIAEIDMARFGIKIDVVVDAAVSADARFVVIRTYGNVLEYDVPPGAALASIWEQTPRVARVEDGPQGEGITYRADAGALITIGESTPTYLYETARQC